MSLYNSKFDSFGSYVPEKIVNNYDLEKKVDTSDEWIRTRTGMFERRFSAPHEAASDLAFHAAEQAIYSSKTTRLKDIQMIIVGTISGDHPFPATACILQKRLGLKDIPAFDISAGCTGFIYAVDIARRYIESGAYNNILVVGVEILTRSINWDDRGTCILFGDGAGAAILKRAEKNELSRIIDSKITADASEWELLMHKAGGSRYPASLETVRENAHTIYMEGNKIFKHAVKSMYSVSADLLKLNNLDVKDLDWIVSHQANLRIIDALADKFKAPKSKVIVTIEKYANTSSSSIPLAVTDAIKEGKIKKGDIVLLTAFGAGLTYGTVIFRY
ncbi:MAG: beta-ketoacyl-ACP synthase III [Candidatus Cloacimonadales bacterium]|jgi:3-oxoacyl-[acyl-carrier-protein] synthase-3|nr:ketoacyl-ACP synthase III [Candidatus Cloacimonadota bacterium]MDD2649977.1 ketoacyl-ACP synthase III [Candidatus Cloacimonadota bacterium]MDX9976503.1 beta-ketoacyl-ACP synthase III [Candidatus Cloacimonadales bacterium]